MTCAKRIVSLAAVALLALAAPASAGVPRITFVRQGGGDTTSTTWARVYSVKPDGSGVKEVTHDSPPVDTYWVAWRPDFKLILFVGRPLETVRADGTHRHKLPHFNRPSADSPAYRPDGKVIAFTTNNLKENTHYAIATIHPDGSHYKQLTKFKLDCQNPTFSPSGKSIAFERGGQIWRMRADGTHMKQVTHEAHGAKSPDWSPNGKRIVYARADGQDLYSIKYRGTGREFIVGGPALVPSANADSPAYEPNGKRIVFDNDGALWTVKPSGQGLAQLTHPTGTQADYRPDW